ncbi:MAG: GntR family transcriptional regulator [Candidatus Gastranaerophilales bacterium]|nr:GntR family transcriptional regulator [Candidatus Gastranaerophilales bacterium]
MPNITENQRKIDINELPAEIPDFSTSFESKDSLIKKWIINWIKSAISKNTIKENDILPKKSEISNYLGVSTGTVQNAIRYVEDAGYLKSKQKLGTMISNCTNPFSQSEKLTSKREKAISAIKKAILQKGYKIGKPIPSTRKMSEFIGLSQNTTRLAYEHLCSIGILDSKQTRGNDSNWYLKEIPEITTGELKQIENMSADTLVFKLTIELKKLLSEKYSIGDKIPSHEDLASMLGVSVKTIHDCVKQLNKEGIVISRRGRYGSILAQNPLSPVFEPLKENSIFAEAKDAAFYSYKKIENKIIDLINNEYNKNDKLPSMSELANKYEVSTNTIRKALIALEQEGYVTFGRGKYGGTFVIDKPSNSDKQSYQWISINPKYI